MTPVFGQNKTHQTVQGEVGQMEIRVRLETVISLQDGEVNINEILPFNISRYDKTGPLSHAGFP